LPTLDIALDRDTFAPYGLTVEEVADTAAVALSGRESGLVFWGDWRFDIVVRLPNPVRNDLDAVLALPSCCRARRRADVRLFGSLNQVSRENQEPGGRAGQRPRR